MSSSSRQTASGNRFEVMALLAVVVMVWRGYASGQEVPDSAAGVPALQAALQIAETEQHRLGERITDLNASLQKLAEELAQLRIREVRQRKETPAKEIDRKPKKIPFRPPVERISKKIPVAVVCENGRASVLDYKAISDELNKRQGNAEDGAKFDLPDFDFDVTLSKNADGTSVEVLRKTGSEYRGETAETAVAAPSKFQRLLRERPASQYTISFLVYPDSYEVFRRLRIVTWEKGYGVDWDPFTSGQNIRLVTGGVNTTQNP